MDTIKILSLFCTWIKILIILQTAVNIMHVIIIIIVTAFLETTYKFAKFKFETQPYNLKFSNRIIFKHYRIM
jgi:hypothetical protein